MEHPTVESGEYAGLERRKRHPIVRGYSLGYLIAVTTLAATMVSVGIPWGTANAQLKNKVQVIDQQRVDAAQERQDQAMQAQLTMLKEQLDNLRPQLDRIEQRVSDIYCNDVPENKKSGCK